MNRSFLQIFPFLLIKLRRNGKFKVYQRVPKNNKTLIYVEAIYAQTFLQLRTSVTAESAINP